MYVQPSGSSGRLSYFSSSLCAWVSVDCLFALDFMIDVPAANTRTKAMIPGTGYFRTTKSSKTITKKNPKDASLFNSISS
jgi:hypothetical protein